MPVFVCLSVCLFTKIFGTLITKTISNRQVFLFSHLTYLVQLLYLGKFSRPRCQQTLNKIMRQLLGVVFHTKHLLINKYNINITITIRLALHSL